MSVRWPGTWVGRWLVEGELARGGSGLVVQARDPHNGERAALKLLVGAPRNEVARARFAREAMTLRNVSHPHLVRLLDSGEQRGIPWLAMELLTGPTLAERLEREGPFRLEEALQLGLALLGALEALHAAGIIHRDLKPSNVIQDPQGRPVLLDLGLARDLDAEATQLSRTGVFMGTPGYMAPEQATGDLRAIGPATDVWGLGATLHALLTGQAPHGDTAHPLEAARGRPVDPPSRRRAEVPPAVDAFLLRCLAIPSAERFPSAEAARRALERVVRDLRQVPAAQGVPLHVVLAAGVLLLGATTAAYLLGRAGASAPLPSSEAPRVVATEPAPPPPAPRPGADELYRRAEARPPEEAEAALADLDAALEVDPDHVAARSRRAALRFLRRDWTGALADYDVWLAREPEAVAAWSSRGQTRLAAGDPEGARRDLDRALVLKPEEAHALRTRGMAWLASGDAAQAAADLERALELDADSAEARTARESLEQLRAQGHGGHGNLTPYGMISRARIKLKRGDTEGALLDYTAALAQDPKQVEGWVERAGLLGQLGSQERSEADASRAIALAPEVAEGWHNRGTSRLYLGDRDGALGDLTRALELDPKRAPTSFARAVLLEALGKFPEAAREAQRYLELEPQGEHAAQVRSWLPELRDGRHVSAPSPLPPAAPRPR